MMSPKDYRAKAEECRQAADRAFSPLDKEAWLRLASDWLKMASMRERTESDSFDAMERDRGTGQTRSEAEH